MNSVKLQDSKLIYRSLLHFYTLTTNYQKEKLRKQFHAPMHQKRIKYPGINLPKEVKDLYSKNKRTLMKLKKTQMERHIMFMDWKNQYC